MSQNNINLPVLPLRDYQKELWRKSVIDDTKMIYIVWHRRGGKDLTCLQVLVAKAMQKVGNYWYLLPQQNQVRRAIWEGVTGGGMKYLDFIPKEFIYKLNNSEMKVVLRDPSNPEKPGSIISFLGGDNYDALVGAGIQGAVVSEHALQKPNLYELALEPMLVETGGWVIFNTTPRGDNHAKEMLDALSTDSDSYTSLLTIEDTKAVDLEVIEKQRRRGKPEELIQQEFYCSFAGAIHGAYYADMLDKYKHQVGAYPYDERFHVHTLWDLGVSDSMAIWFLQFVDGSIRIIDYYENTSYGLGHYAEFIKNKPYKYAAHHLPHDGRQRQLTMEEKAVTIENQLVKLGLNNVRVHKRTSDVYGDIQAVRGVISKCYFDADKTKLGYKALFQYRREWDENRQMFKPTPYHDWSSHAADAFRILPKIEFTSQRKNTTRSFNALGSF